MIAAAALLAVLALAEPDPLEEARSAFAAEDYARAERLALDPASPPSAAALYLAGLARFRAGRPAEALEAIDLAGPDADATPVWRYNRAACLYELGRLEEAEAEFLEAASDPALAAVALVEAGSAALERRDRARAGALAARAREAASGSAIALVDDLDARIAAAAPAVTAPVDAGPAPARRWEGTARAEGGWDGDALQTGFGSPAERPGLAAARTPSAFTAAEVALSRREPLPRDAALDLSYGVEQLAYAAADARDRSLQQHLLSAAVALAPRGALRLGASVEGQAAFAGLSDFRGLQAGAGARAFAAADLGTRATTRGELGLAWKAGLGREFRYLGGERLEAALSQELRLGALELRGGYRFLLERIGETATPAPPVPPSALCPVGCAAAVIEPLGYGSHTGWVAARARLAPWLVLEAGGGVEWRGHLDDRRLRLTRPDGTSFETDRGTREDRRVFTGESLTLRLGAAVSLVLRHELLASRSSTTAGGATSGPRCGAFEGGCRGVDATASPGTKHVLVLGTAVAW